MIRRWLRQATAGWVRHPLPRCHATAPEATPGLDTVLIVGGLCSIKFPRQARLIGNHRRRAA